MESRKYTAKVLLFGEYTVLVGGRALAVPVPQWSGEWQFGEKKNAGLMALADYISDSELCGRIRLDDFRKDIKGGLNFKSSIPWGYGLGSSAALTAAVFDVYRLSDEEMALPKMISELASIESFYHGSSSGLDPIVSLLNQAVLHENGIYRTVDFRQSYEVPQLFLINSGIERQTAPLVALFTSKLIEEDYVKNVVTPLKTHVNHAIEHFLNGSWDLFWEHLRLISEMQFERFKEMLPEPIRYTWQFTQHRSDICLKLCGAGGGGYFLGFARPGIDVEKEIGCPVELVALPNL